jgi:hypothetical protein
MRWSGRSTLIASACVWLGAVAEPRDASSGARSVTDSGLAPEQAVCGQPGMAPCPLQRFMRENVAASLARGEDQAIARSLRKVAAIAPGEFALWASIANEGAAAAEQDDTARLRAACTSCHRQYRAQYRTKYRATPIESGYRFFRDLEGSWSF